MDIREWSCEIAMWQREVSVLWTLHFEELLPSNTESIIIDIKTVCLDAYFSLLFIPCWIASVCFSSASVEVTGHQLVFPGRRRLVLSDALYIFQENPNLTFSPVYTVKGMLCLPSLSCGIVHLDDHWRCQTRRGPRGGSVLWCMATRWQGWQPSTIDESVLWAAH